MRLFKRIVVAVGAMGCTPAALASSPAAWGELNSKASAACLKATELTDAKVRGSPVYFEELVLLIVEGRQPQPHMKNAVTTKYCLYGKTTAKIQVSEMPAPFVAATPAATVVRGQICWSESFRAPLKWPRQIGKPCVARNDEGDVYAGVVRK